MALWKQSGASSSASPLSQERFSVSVVLKSTHITPVPASSAEPSYVGRAPNFEFSEWISWMYPQAGLPLHSVIASAKVLGEEGIAE